MNYPLRLRSGFAVLGIGLALGLLEIIVARGGVQERFALGVVVVLCGAVLSLLPLRAAMPPAVVLACNQGFLLYFVGGPARYWKEAFALGLLIRALRRGAPNALEVAATAALCSVGIAYALRGSSGSEVLWGLKLLVFFLIVGWSILRLEPDARDWLATYLGLCAATAGAVVFALWQTASGVDRLMQLGYPYGGPIRVANGSLRAFAGFTYGAPFAYTLSLCALCWIAFVLCGASRVTIATAWVAPIALLGIALSLNRIALVASSASLCVALIRHRGVRIGAVALVLGVFVAIAGGRNLDFIAQGFTFGSYSAHARTSIWAQRWSDVSAFGHGPSSAGVGADKVHVATAAISAATGASEAVVDNQYLSWLYQYGVVLGIVIAALWVLTMLRPFAFPSRTPAGVAGELVGVFAVVAAVGVNVWEEFPVNFIVAASLAMSLAAYRGERLPARVTVSCTRSAPTRLDEVDVVTA